ncbi:MAG: polysaccharide pyruvyl transferase family protein [Akkermansia sp.]|nr:polysaccharide pyruvyl transferase family protein [Akkermansia sp.]
MNNRNRAFVLTHPFVGNYGGMLQAYALQKAASDCSEIKILDYGKLYHRAADRSLLHRLRLLAEQIRVALRLVTAKTPLPEAYRRQSGKKFLSWLNKRGLVEQNLAFLTSASDECSWVVGSDQVWRMRYVRGMLPGLGFFLDFVSSATRRRSIAYAASFGSDEWEGTPKETADCSRLLREFKAVSVREHSGVDICRDVFGVEAVQMPDPTLLLRRQDYDEIVDSEVTWLPENDFIATYLFNETEERARQIANLAAKEGLAFQRLLPRVASPKRRDRYPVTVAQWLRLIRDCKYFVTDSFHGCVFAIIYNKPFVCLGNAARGTARFTSLLSSLGLDGRLPSDLSTENIQRVLRTPVDWDIVNERLISERTRGRSFLRDNLRCDRNTSQMDGIL